MELRGATAIVTGSSSETGIGAETAKLLASRGCNVVINYVANQAGAERTVAACKTAGGDAIAVKGDVASDDDCRKLVAAAIDRWKRLDILVNNAATTKTIPPKNLDALHADEFARVYSVNLVGNFQMTRAAAPHLRASGDGAVVNISSVGARSGNGSSLAYAASKGALDTLTIGLARQLAPQVRVNAICPGALLGNWTKKMLSEEGYAKKVRDAENLPLKRAVWPIDVARAALWLIADATVTTGELLRLDAGSHLERG